MVRVFQLNTKKNCSEKYRSYKPFKLICTIISPVLIHLSYKWFQVGLKKVQESGVYLKVGETFSDIGESIEEFKKTIQKVRFKETVYASF